MVDTPMRGGRALPLLPPDAGDGRGLTAYGPRMMVRVLLYGYCRGVANVAAEWKLICATHNLLKLFRSGWIPQSA